VLVSKGVANYTSCLLAVVRQLKLLTTINQPKPMPVTVVVTADFSSWFIGYEKISKKPIYGNICSRAVSYLALHSAKQPLTQYPEAALVYGIIAIRPKITAILYGCTLYVSCKV